jgi:kynurenine formamidase
LKTLSHPKALSHAWSSHMPLTPLKLFHTHCHLVSHDINAFPSLTLSFLFIPTSTHFDVSHHVSPNVNALSNFTNIFIVYYVYIWYPRIFQPFFFGWDD